MMVKGQYKDHRAVAQDLADLLSQQYASALSAGGGRTQARRLFALEQN